MRAIIVALTVSVACGQAYAGSIENIGPRLQEKSSFMSFSCADCPPEKAPVAVKKVDARDQKKGEIKFEIKDINGTKKRYSTENWFGGSPVVFVTKVPGQEQATQTAEQPMPVDPSSTTSALNTLADVKPVAASMDPASLAASMATHDAPPPPPDAAAELPKAPAEGPKLADAPPPPGAPAPAIPRVKPVAEKSLETDSLELRLN